MLFSIIITTYNAERFLTEALNSLKNQTVQGFEWIITDDASTDNTLEVCRQWLADNPDIQSRVRIIETPVNTGVSANVNRGLRAASGEWVYVLSGDDALMETALEHARNFIETHPNLSIFQGIAAVYNNDFAEEKFVKNISENCTTTAFFDLSAESQYRHLLQRNPIVAPAVFYKKSIVEAVDFCDERIRSIDDWPLWLKLTKQGHKVHFYNEILVKYRRHDQSIMNENQGLYINDRHRKERLVHLLYIAPSKGLLKTIGYRINYACKEILYRFFNAKHYLLVSWAWAFWRVLKRPFRTKHHPRNPKHIAIFMDFVMGGVGVVLWNYIRILKPLGYDIEVIVAHGHGELYERIQREVRVVNLGDVRYRHAIFKLRKHLKASSVSTVISGYNLANFVAILATIGLRKSCRVIVGQHSIFNQDDMHLGTKGRFVNLGKRLLYRRASRIIAVSRAVAEDLKKHGLPEKKIALLPNPVFFKEIEALAEKPMPVGVPERYVLFIGRLAEVKNVELLLNAFERIGDTHLHLLIIGEGYNRQRLEQRAESMSSHVHFLGVVDNPMPFIKRAEVVAIPSFSEAMPMTAIECCVLGKTIIHTPNTGCVEILGQDEGYCTTRFDDPEEFAKALMFGINNPIDPSVQRQRATGFAAERISERLQDIIRQS